jgi:LmbE family N-acetylglucosaminyl deacetylase
MNGVVLPHGTGRARRQDGRRVPDYAVLGHRRVLAVVAHPDDESFGLGAVLSTFSRSGAETAVLCFTHGEASTLHGVAGDLGALRGRELQDAADVLEVATVRLLDHPDGQLKIVSLDVLVTEVLAMVDAVAADLLLVFDEGGVSGHADHRRATEAARRAGGLRNLPVAAWAIPDRVARALNAAFGTTFQGRPTRALDVRLTVNRERQRDAIARHRSQSQTNPVLWRRLELLGDSEWVRLLDAGGGRPASS